MVGRFVAAEPYTRFCDYYFLWP